MSKGPECDMALLKAVATDPAAKEAVEGMMLAQDQFSKEAMGRMYESAIHADIPAPANVNKGYWDQFAERNRLPSGEDVKGGIGDTWALLKQSRVASMLSNPLTHIKNATATGGHALIVRPLEESMGVLMSRMIGDERRQFTEMYHYADGMARGAQDAVSVLWSIAKSTKRSGSAKSADVAKALQDAGYDGRMTQGKQDLVMTGKVDLLDPVEGDPIKNGFRYFASVFTGNQFSALQAVDTAFKMVSHRSKTQQLLSRQGFAKGLKGEALDDYVVANWDEMSASVKSGEELSDNLNSVNTRGMEQAAEDTFTQTPQTQLGELMSGNFDTSVGWKRAISETMQVIAPFRSIYVNLMRQTLSRRLVPFFDKKTMAELTGKAGDEMQQTALARVAASWTLLAGTSVLVGQAGMKLYGADDVDPAVRDLQFEMYGKVGNTIQIGDQYFPIDMLPPSLALPLTYAASINEAMDEFNYRYHDPEDKSETLLKSLRPFMSAVVEGPWVTEYMDFLSKTNNYVQHGNINGLGEYMASLTLSPVKPPAWIQEYILGSDPYLKTTDGMVGKIMTDFRQDTAAYGHKRNMFGRKIMPLERFGDQSEHPWYGGDTDVTTFLKSANYDKVYGRNVSKAITGDAKGNDGVQPGTDDVQMGPKERDRFEYYVGQSRITGTTLSEDIRNFMNSPGIFDASTGKLLVPEPMAQNAVKKILTGRRKAARILMQYNPEFGIREKQIELYHRRALQNGVDPAQAEQIKRQKLDGINQARMQLQKYF